MRSKHAFASLYRIVPGIFCRLIISLVMTMLAAVSAAFFPGLPPDCSCVTVPSAQAVKFSLYATKNFSRRFQSASYRCITRSFSRSGRPGIFSIKKLWIVFHRL